MTVNAQIEVLPVTTPLVDRNGRITGPWTNFLSLQVLPRLEQSSNVIAEASALAQAAAVATTPIVANANAGFYRIAFYAQVTQAAGVSSSINATVAYPYKGQAVTKSLTAETGNTLTTALQGSIDLEVDAGTTISWSTAYASVGAPVMTYDVFTKVEVL
jgi:hypothetical protein